MMSFIVGESDFYTFLVALLVIYAAYNYLIWPQISPLRAFPGPNYRLPFFGSTFIFNVIFNQDGYHSAQKAHEKYGPISRRFGLKGEEVLLVTGASELSAIFHEHRTIFDRSEIQSKVLKPLGIGNGLLSTRGSEHDIMRRLLTPAFNINNIKKFIPKFAIHADRLLDYWTRYLTKNSIKEDFVELCIQDDLAKMTLNVIVDCAFGYKKHSCFEVESPINKATNILLRTTITRVEMLYPFVRYLPLKINRMRKESKILVEETINKIISKKREKLNNNSEETSSLDMLDRLLLVRDDSGSVLTDKELYDHIITFMFAGYETTSNALTWVLLNLAQNPKIQQRLREEILSMCPDSNADITWKQLEKMPYLNSVIMESLRRIPTVPAFQKVSLAEDVVIGDYLVPANTQCVLWTGVPQNSKDYWAKPENFNPDRFLNSEEKKIIPGTYLPFGSGKYMCIGYKFALTEMKIFLITILRDLVFSTVPGFQFETKQIFTTYPSPFLKLRVQKYEKN